MNAPPMERRRVQISSGTLPAFKIAALAACHPFSEQLDVIFPSDPALTGKLDKLKANYGKGKARLTDVVDNAQTFLNPENGDSRLLATTIDPYGDDVWCIDSRGHLTASLCKETYERAGLTGQKLPYRNRTDRHVIDIPLQKNAQTARNQVKQRAGMERLDHQRNVDSGSDEALWSVVYCATDNSTAPPLEKVPFQSCQVKDAIYHKKELTDVVVPVPGLSVWKRRLKSTAPASNLTEDEDADDWNRHVESLFEWVGMAGIGSQRLNANDRVDSYVAIYEPPESSKVQNVTHLRWRGLLSPTFVKEVLDAVITVVQGPSKNAAPFVAVTCHALTTSPVSYIPYGSTKTGGLQNPQRVPFKLPRAEGEDTWSLILERVVEGGDGGGPPQWCLMESVGQWDSRWG